MSLITFFGAELGLVGHNCHFQGFGAPPLEASDQAAPAGVIRPGLFAPVNLDFDSVGPVVLFANNSAFALALKRLLPAIILGILFPLDKGIARIDDPFQKPLSPIAAVEVGGIDGKDKVSKGALGWSRRGCIFMAVDVSGGQDTDNSITENIHIFDALSIAELTDHHIACSGQQPLETKKAGVIVARLIFNSVSLGASC